MRILVTDPLAPLALSVLREHATVDVHTGLPEPELRRRIPDYDGLVVRSQTRVTAAVLEAGRRLRVVARAGTGVDNIDVAAASRRGIVVVNAPLSVVRSAAEHTIALMLALSRQIPQAHASVAAGQWRRTGLTGVELEGKTLGVIGLGQVGRTVARLAHGLGMRVIAADPYLSPQARADLDVPLVPYDELLRTAHFVTVHVPLAPATRALIGAEAIARTRPGVRIVNCARGGVVDEEALAQALRSGHVAGAAVDVFAHEPPQCSPLLAPDIGDRLVLTPHIGGSTAEAQERAGEQIAKELIAALTEGVSRFPVNVPALVPETVRRLAPQIELAERLGRLAAGMLKGAPRALDLVYGGALAAEDTRPLRAAALRGLLGARLPDAPALLEAHLIAENSGIELSEEQRPEATCGPAGTITLGARGERDAHVLTGSVVGGRQLLLAIDDCRIDIGVEGVLVLFQYRDRPGVVGTVGSILGDADINIGAMRVGRRTPRGEALLVLSLDEEPSDGLLARAASEIGAASTRKVIL